MDKWNIISQWNTVGFNPSKSDTGLLGMRFTRSGTVWGPVRLTTLCCYACQLDAMGKCQAQGTQLHLSIYVRLLLLSLLSHIKQATMSHFNSNWSSGRWRMFFFFLSFHMTRQWPSLISSFPGLLDKACRSTLLWLQLNKKKKFSISAHSSNVFRN